MKLLTVPAFADGQWVVPVDEPPTMPCPTTDIDGRPCVRGWHSGSIPPEVARYKSACPDCDMGTVPLRGRIAIAVPCTWCVDGCDIADCQECGEDYTNPCARHVAAGHIASFDPYGDGVDCSTCCAHCNGLGHLIVASAVVDDVVPVLDADDGDEPYDTPNPFVFALNRPPNPAAFEASAWFYKSCDDEQGVNVATCGTFTPGQHALILSDVKPTTERCPVCWGEFGECSECFSHKWTQPIPVEGGPTWTEWCG